MRFAPELGPANARIRIPLQTSSMNIGALDEGAHPATKSSSCKNASNASYVAATSTDSAGILSTPYTVVAGGAPAGLDFSCPGVRRFEGVVNPVVVGSGTKPSGVEAGIGGG